ncbi:MAG: hypothetical protein VW270_31415, partial [Candidatus Poseidoniales archaeon]
RHDRRCVMHLRLCHMICAINLIVYVCRNHVTLGTNEALGWLVFGLMYACMEVNTQQDQLRFVRQFCATLAVVVTGALAIS